MKRMGVKALYCKPNTSRRNPQHKVWPYLLRGMKIERANQVFALDTTYIPMARGFVYLTAVVDWASRKVLAHRVAITLEAIHAVEALEEAFARYGLPDIVNTDQGSQGGFNRSSQHWIVEQIPDTRLGLPQASSIRESSAALSSMY